MTKRAYTHPDPVPVTPTRLEAGEYLTLADYARAAGINRLTAYARLKRGEITGVRVGSRAILVRAQMCVLCNKPMNPRADGGNAHPECSADIPM